MTGNKKWILAIAAATGVVGVAFADMVYDEAAAPATTTVTTTTVSTEPVVVDGNLKKASDKAKDRRSFQESMNNELVIQRLEEKRLKEEEKLTKDINKKFTLDDEVTTSASGTAAPVLKQEEVQVKPITEAAPSSYQMAPAPQMQQSQVQPIQDSVRVNQSSAVPAGESASATSISTGAAVADASEKDQTRIGLVPMFGLASISNSDGYEFNSRFMAGVGLIFDLTSHVALEGGYRYSEYGMTLGSNFAGAIPSNELVFKNNTMDLGLRLYLTDTDSKIRPFIGGGAAYSWGYLNYTNSYTNTGNNLDYELTQFQGMATAGLEFKISKTVTLGASYKFLRPFRSSENESLNNAGFYNGGFNAPDAVKNSTRGSIRDSNVHAGLLAATLYF